MHNQIAVVALAAAALAACSPDHGGMGPRGAAAQAVKLEAGATSAVATDDAPGAVYTLMNPPRAQSRPVEQGREAAWARKARSP